MDHPGLQHVIVTPGTFSICGHLTKLPFDRCYGGIAALMEQSDRYLSSLTDEERYRLLIEAVTDYAIYMLDSYGVVTSWNPGAERLKGYTAAEIIGQHFSRFYSEQDQKAGRPTLIGDRRP